ncbi:MAG: hypothetical protein V4478_02020 [Patescibacteria group bacterium]
MKKLEASFPQLIGVVKEVRYPAKEIYCFLDTRISHLFEQALKCDKEIDEDAVAIITKRIATWLEYPIIIDKFNDEERSEFERTYLHLEENIPVRDFLDQNKLRTSLLRNIDTYLGYFPSLLQNNELKSRWGQLYRQTVSAPGGKSMYQKNDIKQRMIFIDSVQQIVRSICLSYIKLQGSQ